MPFCQLKSVSNPLARALQEAFVAVERARANARNAGVSVNFQVADATKLDGLDGRVARRAD